MDAPIAIVGRGRLGRTLAALLPPAGIEVRLLAHTDPVPDDADLVLLCVPDAAVADTAGRVPVGPVVAHCAGALDLGVLAHHPPERRASFHPLMTFPGPEVAVPDLAGAPVAVAGAPEAAARVAALGERLGMRPFAVPGDRRLYHAAAVMAGNCATVLLAEASRVLAAAGVPLEQAPALLAPLAVASIRNAAAEGPARALTGPIARGDHGTLAAHREALLAGGLADVLPVYDTLVKHGLDLRRLPERGGGEVP
ncbi:MAG: DUF2520 domain-containing protein [Myxococcota bacterium]